MLKALVRFGSLIVFVSILSLLQVEAQCPDGARISGNGFCLILSWNNPPSTLPGTVSANGRTFGYRRGNGSIQNPAIYRSGGGGGACNSSPGGYTGTITIGGATCQYQNGNLVPPLPVTLIDFTVSSESDLVTIHWRTSSEINNEAFIIERSRDYDIWQLVSRVPGKNYESGEVSYSYSDHAADNGTLYYRLSQIDFDGSITTLGIRAVTLSAQKSTIEVFPNPATHVVNVAVPDFEIAGMELIDNSGRIVKVTNSGQTFIDLIDVLPGLYLIRIMNSIGEQHVRKLVVR